MTEETENIELNRDEELKLLKERADLLGIKYSNNIGVDTLRAKVNERLNGEDKPEVSERAKTRAQEREEQLKLVRIRLSLMNPAKKSWRGEFFTIANPIIGTVRKFVPYNPKFYVNGYHVPQCILNMLLDKKFMNITTDSHGARSQTHSEFINEFAIEILPPLTEEELQKLATEQAAGNRIDN